MDRWIFGFAMFAIVAVGVIASSPVLLSKNQQYVIDSVNNLSQQRDTNKIAILNNLSNKIDTNTKILEEIINKQNLTITLTQNDTKELQQSGSISGFGKPQIIH